MIKANQIDLWSPVADAWEAYRQRVNVDRRTQKAVYEHIWRLIHIEEALVVTLGSALASRLRDLWNDDPAHETRLNKLRSLITGRQLPGLTGSDEGKADACLNGSVGAWTDLLTWFSKTSEVVDCPFCRSLAAYLKEPLTEPIAFLSAWRGVAPVSETFFMVRDRIGRLQAINSFRNKIAHVPISGTRFLEIFRGMRREVLLLLTPDERLHSSELWSDVTTGQWHMVLRGVVADEASFRTGLRWGANDIEADGTLFFWGDPTTPAAPLLAWDATPFVRFNEELKALICFRVNGLELDDELYSAEFHRFAAEIEPVQERTLARDDIKHWFPRATSDTSVSAATRDTGSSITQAEAYQVVEGVADGADAEPVIALRETGLLLTRPKNLPPSPAELRRRGEDLYRDRRYMDVVRAFDALREIDDRHYYNDVAKYKHGSALWRAAEHDMESEEEILTALEEAIGLLQDAAHHRDLDWKSKAYYQLSKAKWHLWRHKPGDVDLILDALNDAKTAADLVYDPTYMSWHDRLQRELVDAGIDPEAGA